MSAKWLREMREGNLARLFVIATKPVLNIGCVQEEEPLLIKYNFARPARQPVSSSVRALYCLVLYWPVLIGI